MNTENNCPDCHGPLPPDAPGGLCPRCLLKSAAGFGEAPTIVTGAEIPNISDLADVARRLPQFEIIALLGQGGMGVVYKARQKQLDRIVALKILPPADALTPDFVERFRREAQSLAKLNHPSIVAIHDFGESGGLYYFAMEFVDGVNLREMIRTGKMKPGEALAVVPKICDALQFAHEEGVVHRDVKPENILIDKRGRVKIADFGLAKLLRREQADHTLTMTGMTLGTPRYMAPEQLDKPETVDHRADIYSLGVVFYEMLTGEVPMGRFAPPSEKVQIDVRLDEIVLHALERDADRRYQHVSQVRDDVEKVTSRPFVKALDSTSLATVLPEPAPGLEGPAPVLEKRAPRQLLPAALVILCLFGLFFGLSFNANHSAIAGGQTKVITVGALDPLYVSESGPSGFSTSLNFVSWSFFAVVVAGVAFGALWRIGREDRGNAARDPAWWRGWWKQVGIWCGLLLIACVVRTVLNPDAVFKNTTPKSATVRFAEDPSRIPATRTAGRTDYAYTFAAPANHRLYVWIEWWKDGNRTIDQDCNTAYVARRGDRLERSLQVVFNDGKVAGPATAGQVRIDWLFDDGKGNSTSGRWRPDFFEGLATSVDMDRVKNWSPKVGETVNLLEIRGGKESIDGNPLTEERLRAGRWEAVMILRARVEAVPESRTWEGTITAINAWNDNEEPSPALLRLGESFGAALDPFTDARNLREQIAHNITKDSAIRTKAEQMLKDKGIPFAANEKPGELLKKLETAPVQSPNVGAKESAPAHDMRFSIQQDRAQLPATATPGRQDYAFDIDLAFGSYKMYWSEE